MLRNGRTSVRMPLSEHTHTGPNRPAYSLRLPSLLSKISPDRSCPSRATLRRALTAAIFPTAHSISRRVAPPSSAALHPAPSPLHHRAALHPPLRLLLLHAAHRAMSPACAEVLPTPPFPTRRSWPLLTPWPLRCATSARRCYDESACCKRMFQVFQTFWMYV
jgi:hypothetical protein